MIRVLGKGSLRALLIWPLGLLIVCALTASSIHDFYGSPVARSGYAAAIETTPFMAAISGSGSGLDSLGGIIANELAIILFSGLALAGIMTSTMLTRANEDAGRIELLTSRPVASTSVLRATMILTVGMLTTVTGGIVAIMAVFGVPLVGGEAGTAMVPPGGALLYGGSVFALGLVWCGLGFACAEIASDTPTARKLALSVFFCAYAIRIITISTGVNAWWATPLGWFDRTEPFAQARIGPVLGLLAVGIALFVCAIMVHARRDLGTGLISGQAGPRQASRLLASPGGLFLRLTRSTILIWIILGIGLGSMFGFLLPEWLKVMELNLDSLQAFGLSANVDSITAVIGIVAALFGGACGISMIGTSASEETEGRLSFLASRPVSTNRIWGTHCTYAVLGALVVTGITLGSYLGSAAVSGADLDVVHTAGRVTSFLVSAALYSGLAALLHGYRRAGHRWLWIIFGVDAVLVFLGEMLKAPSWLLEIMPITSLGNIPAEPANWSLVALHVAVLMTALICAQFLYRRRDID